MAWPNTLQSTNTIPTLNNPMSNLFKNLDNRFGSITTAPQTPSLTTPLAASVDPSVIGTANTSDKNPRINIGQATALASGALGIYGSYLEGKYNYKSYMAQAASYDQQRMLNYESYRHNINYMAEENLSNIAKLLEEGKDLSGAQMAAIGASGFDVSAGEQRILQDTEVKTRDAMYLANRSAYLQSFELARSTEIENTRLLAAAKMARSQAKFAKKMSKINMISGAINTAAGFIKAGYGPYLKEGK